VLLGTPGGAVLPEGIDIRGVPARRALARRGDDHVVTRIRWTPWKGRGWPRRSGSDKVESRHDDGSVVVRLQVAGFPALRSWILGLLDHAEILEPGEFRAELSGVAGRDRRRFRRRPAGTGAVAAPPPAVDPSADPSPGPPVPGRETSQRLRRLLAVVGWLAQVGEAPIADVARRFSMDEDELIRELELAACCGVPPYTPDTLMEIEVSETSVRAFCLPSSPGPAASRPAEGFAVAASARLIWPCRARRRGLAPRPGQTRCGAGIARGDRRRRRRPAVPRRRPAGLRCRPARGDRLPLGLPGRVDHPRRRTGAGDHHGRPLVSRRLLPAGRGHAALPGRSHRRRATARSRKRGRGGPAPCAAEDAFLPGPGAVEVQLHLGAGAQWVPESVPVRAVAARPTGR
jgi:hypothetical protein